MPESDIISWTEGAWTHEPAAVATSADHLDVTAVEPLPVDSPLWDLPNVILAPHTAAISPHEPRRIFEVFQHNIRCLLEGEPMRNVVNTREFY